MKLDILKQQQQQEEEEQEEEGLLKKPTMCVDSTICCLCFPQMLGGGGRRNPLHRGGQVHVSQVSPGMRQQSCLVIHENDNDNKFVNHVPPLFERAAYFSGSEVQMTVKCEI